MDLYIRLRSSMGALEFSTVYRIHIAGASPRTGTTLLAEAMIACFDIDLFCDHEARIFTPAPRQGRIFLTRAPRDILLAGEALAKMANLYVIFMLRDPRNVIVSRHRRDPGRYWAGLKFWMAYSGAARALHSHPRFITLRYEDLLADPDGVQSMLAGRLSFLQATAPFSRYHEVARPTADAVAALGGVRPISPESEPAWRRHLPRVAGQIGLHGSIAADLIEFGYESDDAWMRVRDGVAPDTAPSFWPEHFTPEQLDRMRRYP